MPYVNFACVPSLYALLSSPMIVQASSSPSTSVDTSGQSLFAGGPDAAARPRAGGSSAGTRINGAEMPLAALAALAVERVSGSLTRVAGPRPATMPENVQVPVLPSASVAHAV